MDKNRENYYQILRVSRKASQTDILAAYHAAKGAFSKEALSATQQIASAEITLFLQKIEKAYETLSDPLKRKNYDEVIDLAASEETMEAWDPKNGFPQSITGATLRSFRESANLSLEEVFRITRIPVHYLKAIEQENVKEMPARVYIQGFVKNVAQVYKQPPQEVARLFLEHFDKNLLNRG